MQLRPDPLCRFIPQSVALLIVGVLYVLSREPGLSGHERDAVASRFRFVRHALPELSGQTYKRSPEEMVRRVHPSLRHISALVSFVGRRGRAGGPRRRRFAQ